ncbi:MAG TPA: hypothetical protein VGA41_09665 [Candidatus Dormibacteraeota bacterium]
MSRTSDQVARAAEPVLEPGEIVEVATVGAFGSVSVARTAITAAAVSIATAGLFTAYVTPKKVPIVLTTKRLLILGTKGLITESPDSKIEAQVPRSELRARAPHRRFLWTKVELTDPQGTPVARMQFPLPARGDADRIAKALGTPS